MKHNSKPALKAAPYTAKFISGKRHITIQICNTRIEDWVDKQVIQTHLHISNRTLQTLRSRKQIPYSVIGDKILYYLPGIVTLLEENLFY